MFSAKITSAALLLMIIVICGVLVGVYCLEDDCVPGRRALVECNTCSCIHGHLIHCSRYECNPDKGAFELICVEKEVKIDGCIFCRCFNGDWRCNENICERLKRDINCLNGQTKKNNCRKCTCFNNDWVCDGENCSTTTTNNIIVTKLDACRPDETKTIGCNICRCNADSAWNCTQSQDNCISTNEDLIDDLRTVPCTDNDQFTRNCITCYCNQNRAGYHCVEERRSGDCLPAPSSTATPNEIRR